MHGWYRTLSALLIVLGLGAAHAQEQVARPSSERSADPDTLAAMRAERRVALVVGNSEYPPSIGRLPNPANDARAMAETLDALGFAVTVLLDAGRLDLYRALIPFERALREGSVGLFYYAGHAVQVAGRNFMIPVDAALDIPPDAGPEAVDYVDLETVDLNQVLSRMGIARNRLNIVILDACRDNPFSRDVRSISRGLAQTPAPRGTLIAYATAPGQVALDGPPGGNSIYTASLLEVLPEPGLSLESALKRVRERVVGKSNGLQTPWENSSIIGEFYFRLPDPEPAAAPETSPLAAPELRPDLAVWNAVNDSEIARDFEVFIETYPDSPLVPFARVRLEDLRAREIAAVGPDARGAEATDLRPTVTRLTIDLQAAESSREEALGRLADVKAERDQLSDRLSSLEDEQAQRSQALAEIRQKAAQVETLKTELQKSIDGRAQIERELATERALSREALNQVELLNRQINALRVQLAALEQVLDAEQQKVEEQQVTITDLGSKLSLTLAGKVEELGRFRSEFFGRLRRLLGDRPDVRIVGDRFVFQSEVLFPSASATIEPGGQEELRKLADSLRQISAEIPSDLPWVLQINGHTDRRPINTYEFPSNWELSAARAISVGRFLISQGIPPERIAVAGFGEFQPLDVRGDPVADRRNRRIEIKLTTR